MLDFYKIHSSLFYYSSSYHFGALTNKGELLTWGNYSSGALGHGRDDFENRQPKPKIVQTLNGMFVFAIGFGGWQSSVLAIPNGNTDEQEEQNDFIRTDQ